MERFKKYKIVKKGDNPDLGNFVRYYLHQNKIEMKFVSDGLNVNYATLNRYLKNTSFQFTILWRMSIILNYNFLMDLGQWLKIPFETDKEKVLKAQLEENEKIIDKLKNEIAVLKSVIK